MSLRIYQMAILIFMIVVPSLNLLALVAVSDKSDKDVWDPSLYCDNSEMQKRWAFEALKAIDTYKILDVGSGDGDITREIARRYPQAVVLGLDFSKRMVAFANERHKLQTNLTFLFGDAQNLNFIDQFDLATSFSTLHRVPEPKEAIEGIYNALKPGGKFVAAFPVSGSQIMSDAIALVDSREKWKYYLPTSDRKDYKLTDEMVRGWLRDVGFMVFNADSKREDELFASRTKFRDLLRSTFSQRAALPADLEILFFDEVVDEYLKKMPLDDQGKVHFYFNRIEIIAIKPPRAKL